MAGRDIVAIGTSAGGFEALRFLAGRLPPGFGAAILVTIHLSGQYRSALDAILTRSGPLTARFAANGDLVERGRIYIAPPERHLLVDDGVGPRLWLGQGPKENNARPAIDPMFRSLALCCGGRSVGVVLTGMLGDGASGLKALGRRGCITVVQDPEDAAFPQMPTSALTRLRPDHIVSLEDMPALLEDLVRQPAGEPLPPAASVKSEVEIAGSGRARMETMDNVGRRSVLACPECHGILWEIDEGDLIRYRCHVGHAYTAELLSLGLDESLTRALASALRALDERIALTHKLHEQAVANDHRGLADVWTQRAAELEKEAQVIRSSVRRVDDLAARWLRQEAG